MARDYLGRDQQFYDKLYDFGVDQMNSDSSPAYDMYGDDNVNNWITAAMKVIDAKN